MQSRDLKIGDLVRMPQSTNYWWGGQVGIIDLVEPKGSGHVKYRFRASCGTTARFSQAKFIEVISEAR